MKTLKDIEHLTPDGEDIYGTELRKLAIEWAKFYSEIGNHIGLVSWIKIFFNLTEEDLK